MPTESAPETPWKAIAWTVFAIFAIFAIGGCLSTAGNTPSGGSSGGSSSGGVGSSDYGSSSCRDAGKQEFTSFNDPAWKDYIKRCAPPGVK